jgi:hypothetical protein
MVFKNLMAMWRKPFYKAVSMYPTAQDLSWIPDAANYISTSAPQESPDGSRTTFTFAYPPQALVYNGQLLTTAADFASVGNQAVLTFAPETGASLLAITSAAYLVDVATFPGVEPRVCSVADGSLSGAIDGNNATFLVTGQAPTQVAVYLNGVRVPAAGYLLSSNTLTMLAPYIPQIGWDLTVEVW